MNQSDYLKPLSYPLFRVANLLNFQYDPRTPLSDLTLGDFFCLIGFAQHEGEALDDIAPKIGLEANAIQPNREKLDDFGLVVQKFDTSRNALRINLTPYAKALLLDDGSRYRERFNAAIARWDNKGFNQISDEIEVLINSFNSDATRGSYLS